MKGVWEYLKGLGEYSLSNEVTETSAPLIRMAKCRRWVSAHNKQHTQITAQPYHQIVSILVAVQLKLKKFCKFK